MGQTKRTIGELLGIGVSDYEALPLLPTASRFDDLMPHLRSIQGHSVIAMLSKRYLDGYIPSCKTRDVYLISTDSGWVAVECKDSNYGPLYRVNGAAMAIIQGLYS